MIAGRDASCRARPPCRFRVALQTVAGRTENLVTLLHRAQPAQGLQATEIIRILRHRRARRWPASRGHGILEAGRLGAAVLKKRRGGSALFLAGVAMSCGDTRIRVPKIRQSARRNSD